MLLSKRMWLSPCSIITDAWNTPISIFQPVYTSPGAREWLWRLGIKSPQTAAQYFLSSRRARSFFFAARLLGGLRPCRRNLRNLFRENRVSVQAYFPRRIHPDNRYGHLHVPTRTQHVLRILGLCRRDTFTHLYWRFRSSGGDESYICVQSPARKL